MILAVSKNQIHISVAVKVVLEDALKYALLRNIQVVTAISEGSASERFKPFGGPCFFHKFYRFPAVLQRWYLLTKLYHTLPKSASVLTKKDLIFSLGDARDMCGGLF